MPKIETLARQAWQLKEQDYTVDVIAALMGWPTSAIESWIDRWPAIEEHVPAWHKGLTPHVVLCLQKAGITSREALVEAWEKGEIQRGQPPGINVSRLAELHHWLEETGSMVTKAPPTALIVDLSTEAEAALNHLKSRTGQTTSQVISRLLIEADDINRHI